MNEPLYKATGNAMHAVHMLYLALAQLHQAVCENKGKRLLQARRGDIACANAQIPEALAALDAKMVKAGLSVTIPTGEESGA